MVMAMTFATKQYFSVLILFVLQNICGVYCRTEVVVICYRWTVRNLHCHGWTVTHGCFFNFLCLLNSTALCVVLYYSVNSEEKTKWRPIPGLLPWFHFFNILWSETLGRISLIYSTQSQEGDSSSFELFSHRSYILLLHNLVVHMGLKLFYLKITN